MTMNVKNRKHILLLSLILLVAFIARCWGTKHGVWPNQGISPFMTDETLYVPHVIKFLKEGQLDPLTLTYPPFYVHILVGASYLFLLVSKISGLPYSSIQDVPLYQVYLVGRVVTAFFGSLTVLLVFLIGKRLFNDRIGLFSALVMSICFVHAVNSHYIKADIMVTLLGLASLLFALSALRTKKLVFYCLSGLLVGLSTATNLNGLAFLVPLFVAYILSHSTNNLNKNTLFSLLNLENSRKILVGLVSVFLGFFIGGFEWVLNFPELYKSHSVFNLAFGSPRSMLLTGRNDGIPNIWWYFKYFYDSGLGLPVFFTTFVGLFILLRKLDKEKIFFLSFPLTYFLILVFSLYRTDRLTIPLTPFFAIFSGIFFEEVLGYINYISSRSKFPKLTKLTAQTLLFASLIGYPSYKIFLFDYLLTKPDTRQIATEYIASNFPKDTPVVAVHLFIGGSLSIMQFLHDSRGFSHTYWAKKEDFHDRSIFYYKDALILISGSDYNVVKNYSTVLEYKDLLTVFDLIRDEGILIKEIYEPHFKSGTFGSHLLTPSSHVSFIHNPVIQVYRLPKEIPVKVPPFSYKYLPEKMKPMSSMEIVQDLQPAADKVLFASKEKTHYIAGPYKFFPVGKYLVSYTMKTDDNKTASPVAKLLVTMGGTQNVLAEKEICGTDFGISNEYQDFTLPLNLSKSMSLELKLCTFSKNNIWVKKIKATILR